MNVCSRTSLGPAARQPVTAHSSGTILSARLTDGVFLVAPARHQTKSTQAYAFFSRNWGAFDYDFGAGPRFARVSPAALIDANAAIDPGPGNSSDVGFSLTYQPVQSLRMSFSYTRSK